MIFRHLPFLERLEKVKEAGVTAFEFWGWQNKDVDAIAKKKHELGLSVSSFGLNLRDFSLTKPDVGDEFESSIEETVQVAKKLDCHNLIGPVGLGQSVSRLSRRQQIKNAVENLKGGAPLLEESRMTMLIEPVNLIDHKGCYLSRSSEAAYLIRGVGSQSVKMLFDFYHQQITEGNLINNVNKYFDLIGFFHIGDVPGRHEPGTGEINYRNIFRCIDDLGYKDYVSMEFMPTIDHVEAVRRTLRLASF